MDSRYIIIFDGVCNFCNGSINFIIKRDPNNIFVFVPIQSKKAQSLIETHQASNVGVDTFLLIKNGACYYRTDAALEIVKDLSGLWYILKIFKIFPNVVRDYFYRAFARNRYALFGKKDVCMVPTAENKNRFLE